MNSSAAEKPPGCVGNPGFVFRFKLVAPISFTVHSHKICPCELKFFTLFVWQRGCTSHPILQVTFCGRSIRHRKSAAKRRAKRLFYAADSATERTGLTVLGVASVTVVSSFLIASSKYSMILFAVTSTTTTVPFLRVMLLLSSGFSCFWVILGGFCKNHFLQN
jgi:hypothetical protein